MKTFQLTILTPYGLYLDAQANYVQVTSEDYTLGILPGHSPLISTLVISTMYIKFDNEKIPYAIGGGIIRVEKDKVTLLLDSVERYDEIDYNRALSAKERAEKRLKEKEEDSSIDEHRAEYALARALNRIKVITSKN